MGVTRQPVVQPLLQVHHGQGRLGRHGVKEVQRVQHELAERHGAECTALKITPLSFRPSSSDRIGKSLGHLLLVKIS